MLTGLPDERVFSTHKSDCETLWSEPFTGFLLQSLGALSPKVAGAVLLSSPSLQGPSFFLSLSISSLSCLAAAASFFKFSPFGYATQHVGSSFPTPCTEELNPHPLYWKHRVLTTGPLGKSPGSCPFLGISLARAPAWNPLSTDLYATGFFPSFVLRGQMPQKGFSWASYVN